MGNLAYIRLKIDDSAENLNCIPETGCEMKAPPDKYFKGGVFYILRVMEMSHYPREVQSVSAISQAVLDGNDCCLSAVGDLQLG